ncbi:methyl-accepting chemotaxis protein [Natronocella acetinitrilica]|uniref:Methyl-accepting chemotaxis protein n=1 Tax=Natronocella acetinitrilica TaxID=414046 RepID=A0AAE3G8N6_9GAMM|nr:methyl-accepting chemotaxis protein [Natronocella acetinitrilica]MCP1676498.1 methyl-accepting chemotaxis protein [Natronocella acetinitrilica]
MRAALVDSGHHDLSELYRRGDRLSVVVLWMIAFGSLLLATEHGTWFAWFVAGFPAAAIPTALARLAPGARITRISVGVAYMVLAGLTIHQTQGMLELHFGIFVLLAFLLVYRDWLPIVVAAGVIAVHHLVFHHLQLAGAPVYAFPPGAEMGLGIVLIHAAYVVFETLVLVYLSLTFRRDALQGAELNQIATNLRDGGTVDLQYRFPNPTGSATVGMHTSLEHIQTTLRSVSGVMTRLGELGRHVQRGSEETSESAAEQSTRTTELAAAVTEMSTSIQEVARNTADMAGATEETDQLLGDVRSTVQRANKVIAELAQRLRDSSEQIQRLEDRSQNIGVVVGVIREVTERTNLLALNAAIEAARAGEHGRGFAVVADEVRNLARQTQTSAGEIETLIRQLQEETAQSTATMLDGVRDSSRSADEMQTASGALDEAIERVSRISRTSIEIAAAAEQQSQVADEIDRRLADIDVTAASNRERAKASTRSANEIAKAVTGVTQELQRFRI